MTKNKIIALAGREYSVPPLPLRVNRDVYPICRQLHNDGLLERMQKSGGVLDCTPAEFEQLCHIVYLTIKLVDQDLTQQAFDDMPITPPELLDAYLVIRVLTGAWIETPPQNAPLGEAKRARAPRKSPRPK